SRNPDIGRCLYQRCAAGSAVPPGAQLGRGLRHPAVRVFRWRSLPRIQGFWAGCAPRAPRREAVCCSTVKQRCSEERKCVGRGRESAGKGIVAFGATENWAGLGSFTILDESGFQQKKVLSPQLSMTGLAVPFRLLFRAASKDYPGGQPKSITKTNISEFFTNN